MTRRIDIAVNPANFRRWHERLRDRLRRLEPDAQVEFRLVTGGATWPSAVAPLLALERLLLRRSRETLCDVRDVREIARRDDDADADVVIDLAGGVAPPKGARVLRALYDGHADDSAAVAALLSGAAPVVALEQSDSGAIIATGLPSLEAADGLTGGLEAVFSRVIVLIERALLAPPTTIERMPAAAARRPRHALAFALRSIAFQCAREIYHLCCHSPHWRVGWRFNDGPGVIETGALTGAPWNVLKDRELNFAADPFPFEWRGKTCVFFERLDYRTEKGVIFAQEFDAAGPVGEPYCVLEEPWHLSYPFLIAHEGELYMLPEASASGAITLYRCVEFPRRWERAAELVGGIEAADATIFQHDGRFWMTSVVRDGVGGYSDTLAIHHAPTLFGPWREHAQRTALVDSRFARPAGGVINLNGALWRPVQDCSTGYGKRIVIMRIDALDAERFRQTPAMFVEPGRHWPGTRLHTLNRHGCLECIDGAIFTPKNLALRRMTHKLIDAREMRAVESGDQNHLVRASVNGAVSP